MSQPPDHLDRPGQPPDQPGDPDRPPFSTHPGSFTYPGPAVPIGAGPRPIRAGQLWAGIGLAMLAHVLTIVVGIGLGLLSGPNNKWGNAFTTILIGQLVVFVLCLVVGIIHLVRGNRGVGAGLLIGWGIGVMVMPVVGFGVCVAVLSRSTLA